jgi:hypothetical protein
MTQKKNLIKVALPLDAINKASVRVKSIRHRYPSTLHLLRRGPPNHSQDIGYAQLSRRYRQMVGHETLFCRAIIRILASPLPPVQIMCP